MFQKAQWTPAAMVLAVSACLMAGARPAHAQVRIHLTRGSVTTNLGTGIVIPPSSPGIVTPPSSPGIILPSSSPVITPAPKPLTTPPVITSTPSVKPSTVVTSPAPVVQSPPVVIPQTLSAPQGFSAGPSLLGDNRLPLGRFVNRVGPDIIGDNGPTVQKVIAHH